MTDLDLNSQPIPAHQPFDELDLIDRAIVLKRRHEIERRLRYGNRPPTIREVTYPNGVKFTETWYI
jgi:hypothetical protein